MVKESGPPAGLAKVAPPSLASYASAAPTVAATATFALATDGGGASGESAVSPDVPSPPHAAEHRSRSASGSRMRRG